MMWKTLAGRCIYTNDSGMKVEQNLFYRWLKFDSNALQTVIRRRQPQAPVLEYIYPLTLCARASPGKSCLLGLGGGGGAHALGPYLGSHQLDAVEIDHNVITIADNFFMTKTIKNLNIIHQDANKFVQCARIQYQHLMIDLFDANSFPENCNNTNFFEQCRRLLLPGGILTINLANIHEQWPIFNHIRNHFPYSTVSFPVKNSANMVVLAYKGKSVNSLLDLLNRHQRLKQLTWDPKWGYVTRT